MANIKAEELLKCFISLQQWGNFSEKSLLLLSIEPENMESIIKIAQKMCKQSKSKFQSQEIDLHQFQGKQGESIICLDISWLNKTWKPPRKNRDEDVKRYQKQIEEFAQKLFILSRIYKLLQDNFAIYLCATWKKKNQDEQINKFKEILGGNNYGHMYIDANRSNFSNSLKIEVADVEESLPKYSALIQQNTQSFDSLFKLTFLKQEQKQVFSSLQKLKNQVHQKMISELDGIQNITNNILKSRKSSGDLLSGIFSPVQLSQKNIQKSIYGLVGHIAQLQNLPQVTNQKLGEIYFLYEFLHFQKQFRENPETDDKCLQFFINVFGALKNLDPTKIFQINQKISQISLYNELAKELKYLSLNLNAEYFKSNILGKCRKWTPKVSDIIKMLSSMQIPEYEDLKYYQSLQQILKLKFTQDDFSTKQEYEEIDKKIQVIFLSVKYIKAKKIFEKFLGNNSKRAVQAIKDMFQISEKMAKLSSNNSQSVLAILKFDEITILKEIAQYLWALNRPDLSLEVYKKLKFIYKIQQCVEQISNCQPKDEKVILLLQTSEYFKGIYEMELCKKYAQMAFEVDSKKLVNLSKIKKQVLQDLPQNQKTFIKNFDGKNYNSYIKEGFSKRFSQQIRNLEDNIPDTEVLTVKIKSNLLEKVFNMMK